MIAPTIKDGFSGQFGVDFSLFHKLSFVELKDFCLIKFLFE